MKRKANYSVDNDNRLVVKRKNKSFAPCGNFSVDNKNRLTYFLNEPLAWRRAQRIDSKVIFEGNWHLDDEYNLVLEVTQVNGKAELANLTLKGDIISADGDSLAFQIKTLKRDGLDEFYLMKLSGVWQADEHNRLTFAIKKEEHPDVITLMAAWQLNKNQQIVYTYQKTELKKKAKVFKSFVFQGAWRINSATRLTYMLGKSTKSAFDFRVQVETPNLYPKEGVIKYRIGIGVREEAVFEEKIVCFYGAWKFSRKFGLSFEMNCGRKTPTVINFEAEVNLTGKDEVTFVLTNAEKEPLGFSITFNHKFLKNNDADFFLKLKKSFSESRIEAGVHIPF